MKILFMHPKMPGQFKYLVARLAKDGGHTIAFITKPSRFNLSGVTKIEYKADYPLDDTKVHPYLVNFQQAVFQGQCTWGAAEKLKKQGFIPDLIVGHPSWGDGLFIKDIYPDTPYLTYMEYYYSGSAFYDSAEPPTPDERLYSQIKNSAHLHALASSDWSVTPLFWQLAQFPKAMQSRFSVIHEGISTPFFTPNKDAFLEIGEKRLDRNDEIVTYTSPDLEPMRGFPSFMRAAEILLKSRPQCHIFVVGRDSTYYCRPHASGKTYKEMLLEELDLDSERIHFLGFLETLPYRNILQISRVHVYLTQPFILSWSLLEAMSSGGCIIGSRTPPVMEIIEEGKNGWLADFYSPQEIAEKVAWALDHNDEAEKCRLEARKTIEEEYSLEKLVPLQIQLLQDLADKKIPPPTAKLIDEMHEAKHRNAAPPSR